MIPKEDGFLILKSYSEPPLCLGNKNFQCGEVRWLEMTGCVDTVLGMASRPTEDDHSLQISIPLGSEKSIHSIASQQNFPSSQETPKHTQSDVFIVCYICRCSVVTDLCSYNIKRVLFPWLMPVFLIPNATGEIRSTITCFLEAARKMDKSHCSFH